MKSLLPHHRLLPALCCVAALFSAPAMAQGLGVGVDLGGVSVDVGVGGDSGLDLGVDLGTGDGGLGLGLGGSGGTGADPAPDAGPLALGQEAALRAVHDRKALPLEDILLRAKLLTDGEIIDAQLIAVQDLLLYELKVLGKAGDVSELYFYARSGIPVETD
jgi:hypothetical protein